MHKVVLFCIQIFSVAVKLRKIQCFQQMNYIEPSSTSSEHCCCLTAPRICSHSFWRYMNLYVCIYVWLYRHPFMVVHNSGFISDVMFAHNGHWTRIGAVKQLCIGLLKLTHLWAACNCRHSLIFAIAWSCLQFAIYFSLCTNDE